MGILSRYLLRRFLGLFILALGCTVLLFLVIDYVDNTRFWQLRTRAEMLLYYRSFLPHIVFLILPIAALVASAFSLGNLARHFEITAMRSAGRSILRIAAPILLFGLLLTGAQLYLVDRVLPDANHRRFAIKEPKTASGEEEEASLEKGDFVYIGSGNTYFIRHYSGEYRKGSDVTVLLMRGDTLVRRYDSRLITWSDSARKWVLETGTRRDFDGGRVAATTFEKAEPPELVDAPEDMVNPRIFPDEMNMATLRHRISILKRSGEPTRAFETQLAFKVSGSFVSLVLILLGIAVMANAVKGRLAARFGVALFLTFLYYIFLRLGLVMGENGQLSPFWGAWVGNAVFGTIALLSFARTARI